MNMGAPRFSELALKGLFEGSMRCSWEPNFHPRYWGYIGDNGKENEIYRNYRVYIGVILG